MAFDTINRYLVTTHQEKLAIMGRVPQMLGKEEALSLIAWATVMGVLGDLFTPDELVAAISAVRRA